MRTSSRWSRGLKAAGATVELTTNGILLDEAMTLGLTAAGLDQLWVSLDGATPESYADVRLGSSLPLVLENLQPRARAAPSGGLPARPAPAAWDRLCGDAAQYRRPAGAAAAGDLAGGQALLDQQRAGAHRRAAGSDALYRDVPPPGDAAFQLQPGDQPAAHGLRRRYRGALEDALSRKAVLLLAGKEIDRGHRRLPVHRAGRRRCAGMVRSARARRCCTPMTATCTSARAARRRSAYGSLKDRALLEIWNHPEYVALRRRVQAFDFAPCTSCNCCETGRAERRRLRQQPHPVLRRLPVGAGFYPVSVRVAYSKDILKSGVTPIFRLSNSGAVSKAADGTVL